MYLESKKEAIKEGKKERKDPSGDHSILNLIKRGHYQS
jgi:hypothetical protein